MNRPDRSPSRAAGAMALLLAAVLCPLPGPGAATPVPVAASAPARASAAAAADAAFAASAAAVPLPPLDSMARRVVACTACHGAEGRAVGSAFVPRIAGKPAGYLYRQLLNFRDGQRRHDGMARLLAPLGDDYLREIAGHFAALDLPWPDPPPGAATPEQLARGEQRVRQGEPARRLPACTACHGQALTGVAPAVPGLLGLPADYVTAQLGAWRSGTRRAVAPDCMRTVALALTPEDAAAVAAWLAHQPVPARHGAVAPAGTMPLRCGAAPEAAP